MRIVIYILAFVAALATFVVAAVILSLVIPGEDFGRAVLIGFAVVRVTLAVMIALLVFRAITKRRPPKNDAVSKDRRQQVGQGKEK